MNNTNPVADITNKPVFKVDNRSFFNTVQGLLALGNKVKFRVLGNSMLPFLREGDEVLVKGITERDVKIGNIVLAEWRKSYVLHRIVQHRNGYIWLAGDHNLVQLERVCQDQLIAVLVAVCRGHQQVPFQSFTYRLGGMLWYFFRPVRRIWTKIFDR